MRKKKLTPLKTIGRQKKTLRSLAGLSIIEIIVSTVLLVLILGGLIQLFVGGKRYTQHAKSRMAGGELGKLFLDPLQMQVNQYETSPGAQNGWDQPKNALNIGAGTTYCDSTHSGAQKNPACPRDSYRKLDATEYSAQYDVSAVVSNPNVNVRKVVTTINWTEPSS